MSEKKPSNPQAFPNIDTIHRNHGPEVYTSEYGMTLRDYFAAKAMSAMIASYAISEEYIQSVSKSAYLVADAMLKEREREDDNNK